MHEERLEKKLSDIISFEDYNKFVSPKYPIDEETFRDIENNIRFGFKYNHIFVDYAGNEIGFTIYQFGEIVIVYDDQFGHIVQAQSIYEGEGFTIINNGRILFQPGHDSCGFIYFDSLKREEIYIR